MVIKKENNKHYFIARHREKDGEIQSLWDHLEETSLLAGKFASKIGLENHGKLIGLLHDLGKATSEFYNYICSATGLINPDEDDSIDAKEKKGKIDHSSAGGQVIYNYFCDKGNSALPIMNVLSIIIASHHTGLIDGLTPDGNDNLSKRMNKPDKNTRTKEAEKYLNDNIKKKIEGLLNDNTLINDLNEKLKSLKEDNDSKESSMFKIGLLVKYLFSCLIDADRLNTAGFEFPEREEYRNKGDYVSWSELIERLNSYLEKLESKSRDEAEQKNLPTNFKEVNNLRTVISNHCYDFSCRDKGLYQLTVPTGGGKTLSSLRFALNHANKHQMDRIIYIIPYTSIIDQNAEKAREVLEDKTEQGEYLNNIVLEHHSNLTPDEENTRQKILSENWDAPVVFTTMVQFLEALFGFGTRSARRMHQLANSVIIFDEIQTLPVRCVHLFNLAIRFLIKGCESTIILCTATQPLLDKVKPDQRALQITPEQQMIPDAHKLFKELKRVDAYDQRKTGGWEDYEIAEFVEQELCETGSVLVVVNTKKAAINLFQLLHKHTTAIVLHLSTNMCPAHRMDVINSMKKRLTEHKQVICISTQLIEAGVDIDFGSVLRYLAGLDSITQAAGRCNRNGARSKPGRVFVINPKDENLKYLKDIKIGREKAERILGEYKEDPEQFDNDILGLKAMERYYQYYFYDRNDDMCYKVSSNSIIGRSDNIFELLSTNKLSVQSYKRLNNTSPEIFIRQSFMSASKAFQVIDSSARGVIVPYKNEGKRIINELCSSKNIEKQYKLLKKAQRYSINLCPFVFEKLVKKQIIHEAQQDTGVYYLNEQYYDVALGMSELNIK